MTLYLVRHGDALALGPGIERDADRILSAQGEMDSALMGRALAHIDPNIDIILTSPLVRAAQTGEIMRNEFTDRHILRVSERLAPGFNHRSLVEEIIAPGTGEKVVAVGHQPDLSLFVSFLVCGSRGTAIAMSTCSIACIGLNPSSGIKGQLNWLLTPTTVKSIHPQL